MKAGGFQEKLVKGGQAAARRVSSALLSTYFQAKLDAELVPHDLKRRMDAGETNFLVLDVRDPDGFKSGHIPGAKNIPLEDLANRLKELPRSKEIITYCWSLTCMLCTRAALYLAKRGFRTRELVGGIEEWEKAGFKVEKG